METIFADAVNATLNSAQYNNNTLFHCSIPDINECKTGATECHENAECSNTDVGFLCVCVAGFTGNGTHCDGMHLHGVIFSVYYPYYYVHYAFPEVVGSIKSALRFSKKEDI